ncbi:NAD(P)-dependent oxidoreductase [Streptomyces sp. AP-93]|uniref:NAD-dependent epimerase/dehydratase family protein n=1 Tax=Streptomyces sp. AP-93 TaxID=2929048 RepID=UPI001FAEA0EA|nr:NAD-dependent epimerase/dehydratase family protein [Streptomyces sp. AP-93]MCJ0875819.1 NAD-dependent epimerase/dehydratase family protein [Streptomyces sp. AP-93]
MPLTSQPLPRVAVLGATGFIGRALCATLDERGHGLLAVARKEPTVTLPGEFVAFDLTLDPPAALAEILTAHRIDVVVNAAGGDWGLTDEQMVPANLGMVERLLETLGGMAKPPRLVHIGSVHEYGLFPVGTTYTEDSPARPSTVYGRVKLRATELITEAVRDQGLDALVLRLGNVVGAGQPVHSLLGVMAGKLAEGRAAGGGAELSLMPLTAQREFLHLGDAVEAIAAALVPARGCPPVLNLGLGRATSAREVVELLIEESRVPTRIVEVPAPAGSGPETEWHQLDMSATERALDWKPTRSLQGAVAELWAAVCPVGV